MAVRKFTGHITQRHIPEHEIVISGTVRTSYLTC